jgi:hypothetical protein
MYILSQKSEDTQISIYYVKEKDNYIWPEFFHLVSYSEENLRGR